MVQNFVVISTIDTESISKELPYMKGLHKIWFFKDLNLTAIKSSIRSDCFAK